MNYEEFVVSDRYGAFSDYTSVKNAKETGLIPPEYEKIFPDKCECGSDMIISDNRTFIKCCDPRCPIKLGKMLSQTFANFGMKNVGDGTTIPLIKEMIHIKKISSHVAALRLDSTWKPLSLFGAKGDIYYDNLNQIFSKKYTLGDLISKIAIPSLDTTAKKIFDNYPSVESLLQHGDGDLRIPLRKCGIYDTKVVYYLDTYLQDIYLATELFKNNILSTVYDDINIVITGSVAPEGVPMSRNEFIEYINELTILPDGRQIVGFKLSGAVQSVEYIIADQPSNSRKYKIGLERNIIISSTDFVKLVKDVVDYQKEVLGVDE